MGHREALRWLDFSILTTFADPKVGRCHPGPPNRCSVELQKAESWVSRMTRVRSRKSRKSTHAAPFGAHALRTHRWRLDRSYSPISRRRTLRLGAWRGPRRSAPEPGASGLSALPGARGPPAGRTGVRLASRPARWRLRWPGAEPRAGPRFEHQRPASAHGANLRKHSAGSPSPGLSLQSREAQGVWKCPAHLSPDWDSGRWSKVLCSHHAASSRVFPGQIS
jgi:hypothetical protein